MIAEFFYKDGSKTTFPLNHSFTYFIKKGRFDNGRPVKIIVPIKVLHNNKLCKYLAYYINPINGIIIFK